VARVIVTPRAQRDVDEAIVALNLCTRSWMILLYRYEEALIKYSCSRRSATIRLYGRLPARLIIRRRRFESFPPIEEVLDWFLLVGQWGSAMLGTRAPAMHHRKAVLAL
jgi:hypothetical protein